MSGLIWAAVATAFGAVVAAGFAYLSSRKTTDDSTAIALINAGQKSLESALEYATTQLEATRKELAAINRRLAEVIRMHEECEDERLSLARELSRLRENITRRPNPS